MKEHDTCISKNGATETGWGFLWIILFGVVAAGVAGYAVYKYRIRRSVPSWLNTCPWTTKEMFRVILIILRCEENEDYERKPRHDPAYIHSSYMCITTTILCLTHKYQ